MKKWIASLPAALCLLSCVPAWSATPVGGEVVAPDTPYSPGILAGDTLYVAALQGTDLNSHALPADFGQETRNCLDNLGRVLSDAHMDFSDVVSVQVYLDDMSLFKQMNAIYKTYFKRPRPARTTVQVGKLPLGAHIEIAAIARR